MLDPKASHGDARFLRWIQWPFLSGLQNCQVRTDHIQLLISLLPYIYTYIYYIIYYILYIYSNITIFPILLVSTKFLLQFFFRCESWTVTFSPGDPRCFEDLSGECAAWFAGSLDDFLLVRVRDFPDPESNHKRDLKTLVDVPRPSKYPERLCFSPLF